MSNHANENGTGLEQQVSDFPRLPVAPRSEKIAFKFLLVEVHVE